MTKLVVKRFDLRSDKLRRELKNPDRKVERQVRERSKRGKG